MVAVKVVMLLSVLYDCDSSGESSNRQTTINMLCLTFFYIICGLFMEGGHGSNEGG